MVRHANWILASVLGLMLAWEGSPALAQRFTFDAEPSPNSATDGEKTDEYQSQDADQPMDGQAESDDDSYNSNTESDEYNTASDEPSQTEERKTGDNQGQDDAEETETDENSQSQEPELKTETIKERYPNGQVKVEREVTQDAAGNYLNNGAWKMWDERGNLMAQGQFRYGNRTGAWIRWYRSVSEAKLLTQPPYRDFAGPFISQATFRDGQLHGTWTIFDGKVRKISQWAYVDGRRHGLSTWWHTNGRKARDIEYRDGEINGTLTEWGPEGAVLLKESYQDGRKLAQKASNYNDGKKKSQGMYLFAKDIEKTPDDWWNLTLISTIKSGKDEKHGAWTSWYQSGQRQLEGTYEHDLQVGLFTWWHDNGQKSLEGRYDHGKQDGGWTWWYPSGQKSIQGSYVRGNPTGRWTWWKEDGKVVQSADLSGSEGVVIQESPTSKPKVLPQVRKPTPRQPTRR